MAARTNFLAQDRMDIAFGTKDVTRRKTALPISTERNPSGSEIFCPIPQSGGLVQLSD